MSAAGNEARHHEPPLSGIGLTLIVLHRPQNDPLFEFAFSSSPKLGFTPQARLAESLTARPIKISDKHRFH
jgi:hypothetical protein